MIEPKRHDVVGLSPLSGRLVHSAGDRSALYRKPLRLTISVEKIDRFLADIQKHVEDLHRQMTNLRRVRTQVAVYQQESRGEAGQAPYIHRTLVGRQFDS